MMPSNIWDKREKLLKAKLSSSFQQWIKTVMEKLLSQNYSRSSKKSSVANERFH
jgi:hypothetical protein